MTKEKENLNRAKAFKAWKELSGLSYEQIAEALGLHQNTVVSWGIRGRRPRDIFREKIAEVFPSCPIAK